MDRRSRPRKITNERTKAFPGVVWSIWISAAAALVFWIAGTAEGDAADGAGNGKPHADHPGKAIYTKLCQECHGANGEGNREKEIDPLTGRRTLESLAGRIERTMPEDNEEACVGKDASSVADYIYNAFYSPAAQARNRVFRPHFGRLTAGQYQNAVIDLFAAFRKTIRLPGGGDKRGLSAVYVPKGSSGVNRSADFKDSVKRIDSRVHFDFAKELPDLPEGHKFKPTEFGIIWKGGIFARHTGVYEFTIRTRNGAYLNINEPDENRGKLIDAWVATGNQIREESGKIFLIGGRTYPFDLHFFKYNEEFALIELYWTPPLGMREPVPEEVLTPETCDRLFVPDVSLPPDDRSLGYETGASLSRAWLDAITEGALQAADHAAEFSRELARIGDNDPPETASQKITSFAEELASTALRRPLRQGELDHWAGAGFAAKWKTNPDAPMRRFVVRLLTSPEFLYPAVLEQDPQLDKSWKNAQTLALTLWDTIPDKALRLAAGKGELDTIPRLRRRAGRMLAESRAHKKIDGFFDHWLELDRTFDIAKDRKKYPEFNEQLLAQLRTSLELFLDDVVWSESSDYRRLLLEEKMFSNDALAKIYGIKFPGNRSNFIMAPFPGQNRAGVVTHPLLLLGQAYHDNSSPIHRGVFLTRNIAGLPLQPPKEAAVFDNNKFDPSLSMREKVTQMTEARACMTCHSTINPLGFSLEHYDAIGRWRERDAGKPVNDDTVLKTDSGKVHRFHNARDVAEFAVQSPEAHRAFVRFLFHHLTKQPMEAYGIETSDELTKSFRESGFHIQKLICEIAVRAAEREPFRNRSN